MLHCERGKIRKHVQGYAIDVYHVSGSERVKLATAYGGDPGTTHYRSNIVAAALEDVYRRAQESEQSLEKFLISVGQRRG